MLDQCEWGVSLLGLLGEGVRCGLIAVDAFPDDPVRRFPNNYIILLLLLTRD